jgi:5-methyltetrahydropteroyltriglutamate--homocysteine methyltransferase
MAILECGITGSLPKPQWLSDPTAPLRAEWILEGDRLDEARDDAVRLAIADQEAAGLDIVTDGEQRRRHYIWGFLEALDGIDTATLGRKQTRGGRYAESQSVVRIVGDLKRRGPIFVDALAFARAAANRPVKVTLPGPSTIVDTVLDEHYGEAAPDLAMRFADLLNLEARALAKAGADCIQFDEPAFNIDTDAVAEWGIAALERAAAGVSAPRAVHICYGYGVPSVIAWKSKNQDWGYYAHTLPLLNRSTIDQVSVEVAASGVDVSVIGNLPDKRVMLGVISVSTDEVETPELVAARIRAGLEHCEAERLMPCTDCGLVPRPRDVARAKMAALGAGTALVRATAR